MPHKIKIIVLSLFLTFFIPLVLLTFPWSSVVTEITRPEPKLVYSVNDIDAPEQNKHTLFNPNVTVEKFAYEDDVVLRASIPLTLPISFISFDYDFRVGNFSIREMLYDLTRVPGQFVGSVTDSRVLGKTVLKAADLIRF